MKVLHRSVMTLVVLALPQAGVAQQAINAAPAALLGTWVRSLDGRALGDSVHQGATVEQYIMLRSDSTYTTQVKTKTPSLLRRVGALWANVGDSTMGKGDTTTGEGVVWWGRWRLRGDQLKVGHNGRRGTYGVQLRGQELSLLSYGNAADTSHHLECTQVFGRFELGKPLPKPSNPSEDCQMVAGPIPPPPGERPVQVADLLGTWAYAEKYLRGDWALCGGRMGMMMTCWITRYDTLMLKADSTLVHKALDVGPAKSAADPTVFIKMRWWMSSPDSLWTTDPTGAYKEEIPIALRDNGRLLLWGNGGEAEQEYTRVAAPSPAP